MTREDLAREREAFRARHAERLAAEPEYVPTPRAPMGGAFHVQSRAERRRAALADEYLPPRTMDVSDA